jgi:hypothetical protein
LSVDSKGLGLHKIVQRPIELQADRPWQETDWYQGTGLETRKVAAGPFEAQDKLPHSKDMFT